MTLARILYNHDIPVTVYELDASPSARVQGGTLDLHNDTGLAAVRKAGLFEQFQKHARYQGEDLVIADRHATHFVDIKDADTGRPEIDRPALRQILLDSLPSECIQWGRSLKNVEAGTLHFEHETVTGFDLIIGADGAWSKVRKLLTPVLPFYSGISMIEFHLRDIATMHPELSEMIGQGSYFAFGEEEGRAMLCQRQGNGDVRVYCADWHDEDWIKTCGIDFSNADQVRENLLKEYSTWAPELQDMIRYCDDDIVARPLYMLPVGLRWASKHPVTVIGDAAHLCTPFAGEGVNSAMMDAMVLADKIIENTDDFRKAVKDYEEIMFGFAKKVTQRTWDSLLDRFEQGGIAKFQAMVKSMQARREQHQAKAVKEQLPSMERLPELAQILTIDG